ncbi:hypothetical protein SNE40_014178 [Patella caerulea]|uniref:Uncharacterized protein n=1 Tax=Patella caerulea TaxID=87958 RepID=A0AAN8JDF2_PATCE
MGTQGCYFYQQTCFRATPKRFRKLPEELPDSLKFAHLNPKLAALMANKEKQKQDEMMDVLSKRSIMSEINTTFQNFKSQFDFVLLNDEDSQRYLFEEAKFTAGNTLEQLASFIYRYKNIVKIIPKSLEYQMLSSYQELIADIVYMPREWQILSMKEPLSKCSDNNSEEDKTVIDEDVRIARPSSEPGKYKKKHTTKVGMPEITEEHKTDKTSNRRNDSRNSMTVSRAKNRLEKGKSTLLNDKLTG